MSEATRSSAAELELDLEQLRFDERGLITVVVQHATTGAVLMVAWANREAVELTLQTGRAHFFSRSRQQLWRKGETSGNELLVVGIEADCDRDTLLTRARPLGPTCHTGSASCFASTSPKLELGWLAEILRRRVAESAEESYTARLLERGLDRVTQKVGEEAVETVIATLRAERTGEPADRDRVIEESADLLYHLLVLWQAADIAPDAVAAELDTRHFGRLPEEPS